jgi:CRISPR/Cas system CMR-associated protein Cmr3 (group 5 of RAMP superfamily)
MKSITISKDELIDILSNHLNIDKRDITSLNEVFKKEVEEGFGSYDRSSYSYFDGVEIRLKK